MSKLIKIYKDLKTQNKEKIYLFKSGIFYIFLDEDAKEMSKALDFKLTNLNDEFVKCGFPSNSFDKYMSLIKKLNYDVEIVNPNINLSLFKFYIRLSYNNKYISLQNYQTWCRLVTDICNMLGGWINSCHKRQKIVLIKI